jgi:hypothetical protein
VPHFAGLHAVQVLALVAAAIRRRWQGSRAVRLVLTASASYAGLFGLLLWQAVRGESIVDPTGSTLAALAVWAAATILVIWRLGTGEPNSPGRAAVVMG